MSTFIMQLLIQSLIMGCIYALVAISYNMILNATGVVNFAQGEWVMVGMFISAWLAAKNINVWVVLILVVGFMVFFGFFLERVTYRPLHGKRALATIIATIGVSTALQNLAQIIFGTFPMTMTSVFGENSYVQIFGVNINSQYILIIVASVILVGVQFFLFKKTTVGSWMTAVSMDSETASLMGIPVAKMLTLIFIIAAVYSGIAGWMMVPVVFATAGIGTTLMFKAVAACVIGGYGNIQGAIIGSLIVGAAETFASAFISSAYKDSYAFLILLIVLTLKPGGLFSAKIGEKV